MFYQAARFIKSDPPDSRKLEDAIAKTVTFYPRTTVPKGFRADFVCLSRAQIRDCLQEMNKSAVPGYPYSFRHPTKGAWIENSCEDLVDAVLKRLKLLEDADPSDLEKLAATELVDRGYVDPVAVFVKNEPHKVSKIKEGRYRLISNCSIVDECIKRLVYGVQNDADKDDCYSPNGSAGGWDWTTDQAAKKCYDSLLSWLPQAATSDVSAWDWSLNSWLFTAELEVRRRLNGASAGSLWFRVASNITICFGRSVYILSDGSAYVLQNDGVQKSGDYNTTTSNGRMRNLLSCLLGCENSKSMGDDNVSTYVDGAVEKALEYGVRLTDYRKVDLEEGFEFCSSIFNGSRAIPLTCVKALYSLLADFPSEEKLLIFLREFRHAPELDSARAAISASGYLEALNLSWDEVDEWVSGAFALGG